ncbi:MAG: L,D-transpeptidase [Hyphomicrobiales bacterium]|nr:L,D-transpeptidase [Hyphomicrobiales bacterium]
MRSAILAAATALLLAGCNNYARVPDPKLSQRDADLVAMVPHYEVDNAYGKYEVDDPTGQPPGTIVVDTSSKFLYYVLPGKKAIRYGVATGSEAFGWKGTAVVGSMQEWPRWIPPADMIQRWPHLKPVVDAGGLPGGPDNPLGARALYLYQGNKDTLYRIHGTNEEDKIGQSVSSGCIRMRDVDVIDLYSRAKVGGKVVVM